MRSFWRPESPTYKLQCFQTFFHSHQRHQFTHVPFLLPPLPNHPLLKKKIIIINSQLNTQSCESTELVSVTQALELWCTCFIRTHNQFTEEVFRQTYIYILRNKHSVDRIIQKNEHSTEQKFQQMDILLSSGITERILVFPQIYISLNGQITECKLDGMYIQLNGNIAARRRHRWSILANEHFTKRIFHQMDTDYLKRTLHQMEISLE